MPTNAIKIQAAGMIRMEMVSAYLTISFLKTLTNGQMLMEMELEIMQISMMTMTESMMT